MKTRRAAWDALPELLGETPPDEAIEMLLAVDDACPALDEVPGHPLHAPQPVPSEAQT